MSSRIDKHTERFVSKMVHGQMVKVRVLKPHMEEDEAPAVATKKRNKKYCTFCETEIFNAGNVCDLCGREL
jgi:hypothetical protein